MTEPEEARGRRSYRLEQDPAGDRERRLRGRNLATLAALLGLAALFYGITLVRMGGAG